MYFNLTRYVCQFIFYTITAVLGMFGRTAFFPLRLAFRVLAFSMNGFGKIAVKPARQAIYNKFHKPAPSKRYMKTGKPAIAPLITNASARPALNNNAGVAVSYQTDYSREDLMRRAVAQKKEFVSRFTDVVQIGA